MTYCTGSVPRQEKINGLTKRGGVCVGGGLNFAL